MADFTFLSLGAGVQSTCVLLMSCLGEIPKLDFAVFADTGWEPAAVYSHLETLAAFAESHEIPVHKVSHGNIRADHLLGPDARVSTMPLYVDTGEAREGKVRRSCTRDYKIMPIRKFVQKLMVDNGWATGEQWFGISWDEIRRMRTPDSVEAKYLEFGYPLIDRRMTRTDCETWMADHDWSAPRSACIGCPFHRDHEWRRLRDETPAEWEDAVAFDRSIREIGVHGITRGEPYLHRSLAALDEVDLRTPEDRGQGNLFDGDEECGQNCFL